jgi:hypothetical protein
MAQQVIVKFNVGGTRYEVSQSLLQSCPDSMLAKSAATQWHTDPNAEIFVDRNGTRFQYVLDYLRDGQVDLPVFVSKASLLLDLDFFGVPVNENIIVVNTTDFFEEVNRLQAELDRVIQEKNKYKAQLAMEKRMLNEFVEHVTGALTTPQP